MTTPSDVKAELLPCPNPWCEESAVSWRMGASRRFVAECKCGISGPWSDTAEAAIAAWNTRPQPSPKVEQVPQWRCFNCKHVYVGRHEPNQCDECWCREFAQIDSTRPQPSPKVDGLVSQIRVALTWIEPPFITAETEAHELRNRISMCLADIDRALTEAVQP